MCDDVVMIIHHDAKRLSKNEGGPDDYVAPAGSLSILPHYDLAQGREGQLGHHSSKGPNLLKTQI